MDMDDLDPRKPAAALKLLDPMSIDELRAYIVDLEAEIERVRKDIARKESVRAGAEAFFKR
ncbi:conserved hypothetical protein [Candidatus Terasakiella magnetica]|nr:conserved hypothetical protein [Candidatus Terasakiella magnetica]